MPMGRSFSPAFWDAIYQHWCAGQEPVSVIAASYGIPGPTIHVHAKANGWPARPRVALSSSHQAAQAAPDPKPVRSHKFAPGDRICRNCMALTRSNPCNICAGRSDPVPSKRRMP